MLQTRTTGAHAVLAALRAGGITTIFGLPGSTEAPLLEALREDGGFRYVRTGVEHEEREARNVPGDGDRRRAARQ